MIARFGLGALWMSDVDSEVVGLEGDATSHMSSRMPSRIAVIARVSGRRWWTVDQKLQMLRDAFGSGGCVRTALERHGLSSGQLYTWRRQAMSGELTGIATPVGLRPAPGSAAEFAQVEIIASDPPALRPLPCVGVEPSTRISIELVSGIRLTVDTGVDAEALARVLSVICQ